MTQTITAPVQTTIISTLPHKDTPAPQDRLLCLQQDGTLEQLLASSLSSQGAKGDKGDIGAQGPTGEKGEAGPVGPQGPVGQDGKDAIAPPLVIFPYYHDLPPDGYLMLQGNSFDSTMYPILAQKFPNAVLPDLRNRVPRGVGNLIALGEIQEDALQNIQGNLQWVYHAGSSIQGHTSGCFGNDGIQSSYDFQYNTGGANSTAASTNFDASRSVRTSDETRVKAVGLNFIIKAA